MHQRAESHERPLSKGGIIQLSVQLNSDLGQVIPTIKLQLQNDLQQQAEHWMTLEYGSQAVICLIQVGEAFSEGVQLEVILGFGFHFLNSLK